MIYGKEEKGSKYQLQEFVNSHENYLNDLITKKTGLKNIQWISPLKKDDHAELFDSRFRDFIDDKFFDVESSIEWKEFWPMTGGPRWDGIAISDDKTLLLVEAKSYPNEARNKGSKASALISIELIKKSLDKYAGNENLMDSPYYQFANRVAFTNFLNEQGIKTTLLLLNFYEDTSHTNPACIVSKDDFICQSKFMISQIDIKYQSHVSTIYIKAIN